MTIVAEKKMQFIHKSLVCLLIGEFLVRCLSIPTPSSVKFFLVCDWTDKIISLKSGTVLKSDVVLIFFNLDSQSFPSFYSINISECCRCHSSVCSSVSSGSVKLLADGLLWHQLHSLLNNVATTTTLCPQKCSSSHREARLPINKMVTMQNPDKIWMLFILWKWQMRRKREGPLQLQGDDVKKDFNRSNRKGLNSRNNRHKTFLG